MNEIHFTEILGRIYAAFGKNMPAQHVRDAIYERIQPMPDAFMDYAKKRLCDMEALPQNLGLYLERDLWPDFKAANPELEGVSQKACCPLCDPGNPGQRRVHAPDYSWVHIWKCPCNTDPSYAGEEAWTDALIAERGFHTEAEFQAWVTAKMQAATSSMAKKILPCLCHDEPPRERHAAYLRKMEGAW